jgi:hypothetical protein
MHNLITAKYKEPRMARRLIALSCLILTVIGTISIAAAARAAELGPVAKYLTDDVLAVGYLDLTKFNAGAAVDEFAKLGVANEAEVAQARLEATKIQAFYDELTKRGARRAFVLLRIADIQDGGPTWLVEVGENGDAAQVRELLAAWRDAARGAPPTSQTKLHSLLVPSQLAIDGHVVVGGTSDEIARLDEIRVATTSRPEAAAALDGLLASDGGLVAFGDPDSRRVLREMFPQLPDPFAAIDGKLIADNVKWAGVTFKLPPTPTIGVTIEAASSDVALRLQEAANNGLTLLKGLALGALASGETEVASALPALALLKPEVDGTRISMTLGDDPEDAAAFRSFFAPLVNASREAAWRSERMNDFKHIALGMLNYDDAKGSYPAQASYDAGGKPLLSWRVAILPYIDQGDLYKQFHLDEPWDSEHNRALIAKMPAVYADPAAPDLAAVGRTTYLVPVGEGMVSYGAEGTKIREVIDGTSNTILVVEVTPDLAVEWTKPADWEVDLSDPLKGVRRKAGESRGNVFAAAFCDGSVRIISNAIEPSVLKALLTITGKENIPREGIK